MVIPVDSLKVIPENLPLGEEDMGKYGLMGCGQVGRIS